MICVIILLAIDSGHIRKGRTGMSSTYKKGYTDKKTIEYIKNNYDQVSLRVPKGDREKYKRLAEVQGKSLNQMIIELLDAENERVLKEEQAKRVLTYAERINEKVATLSVNKEHYSIFQIGNTRIKFYSSPFLTQYCEILKWDDTGYIECTCLNTNSDGLVEDSIDLAFIADRLHLPLDIFKGIEEVRIV